jgi:hypothetical protein
MATIAGYVVVAILFSMLVHHTVTYENEPVKPWLTAAICILGGLAWPLLALVFIIAKPDGGR